MAKPLYGFPPASCPGLPARVVLTLVSHPEVSR